ncbi:heme-binding domain-containing protein [Pedobacter sp. KR3-3]|uniref:Heme-binding domain-containing protein n=1 Tax=Pedobacter albus TaxID=3113905 RepID=A0ABU7I4B7_9SPHI|nr:heme-binding domain-containing protein [Pedobacter sp. KR3-3]MEE1944242.1 heme-binding domain-containing protein [Pedobacter sp. KR3-3]
MKGTKKVLLGILVIVVVIQFIHPARNQSGQAMPNDISKIVAIPKDVQGILKKACYDCHSNNTEYPWYTNIQPIHWFMNYHIVSGKEELNFNEFGTYTPRRQQSKLRSIENSLKDGTMPLSSYTLIHRNAILSEVEKSQIINWVQKSKDSLKKYN